MKKLSWQSHFNYETNSPRSFVRPTHEEFYSSCRYSPLAHSIHSIHSRIPDLNRFGAMLMRIPHYDCLVPSQKKIKKSGRFFRLVFCIPRSINQIVWAPSSRHTPMVQSICSVVSFVTPNRRERGEQKLNIEIWTVSKSKLKLVIMLLLLLHGCELCIERHRSVADEKRRLLPSHNISTTDRWIALSISNFLAVA